MKKVLASVMAVFIVLTSLCVFAETTNLEQIKNIGIMDGIEPSDFVTRAQMARIITQTMNIENADIGCSFDDVSDKTPYYKAIGTVQSLGIMKGCGGNIFAPDREITYNEVIKTTVTLLGYEPLAQARGGYPNGYIDTAKKLGITEKNLDNKVVTAEEIAQILIKAIDTPLMEQVSFGIDAEYQVTENTIKTKYLK